MTTRARSGTYKPVNPSKYIGDPNGIVWRSTWERAVFRWCDLNSSILKWASEEVVVPYFDRASNKTRRYFPDVLVLVDRGNNQTETILIEIKPKKECAPPTPPKKNTKKAQERYINEMSTYATNQSKWEAAEDFCRRKGWKFMVLTEQHIFTKGSK